MLKFLEAVSARLGRRPKTELEELKSQAFSGEKLEELVLSGHLDLLQKEILDPMEWEAYEAFKKVDPADFNAVCQTQKMGQVVDMIKKRLERKIELGRQARVRIVELAIQEE